MADNLTGVGIVSSSVGRLREGRTLASQDEAEFGAFAARTGRPLVTLLAQRAVRAGSTPGGSGWAITSCAMPSVDGTGDHLLVSCDRFGRLDCGRFTSLPGAAPQLRPAAAW